jgi:hypothetical protein
LIEKKIAILLIILLWVVGENNVFGQSIVPDSIICKNAIDNTVALYTKNAGIQSGIYNGIDYSYQRINSGHVFFETDNLVNGDIMYNGIEYKSVPMLYDIVKDEVIIQGAFQPYFILLASDKVSQFVLSGHTFVMIYTDSLPGTELKTGFYQRLYNGKTKAFAKNKKIIEDFVDIGNAVNRTAFEKDKWYIFKDGIYFEVKGKSSILKVLKDKKKEIQQFSKREKINYKSNMEDALTRIVTYYDTITY